VLAWSSVAWRPAGRPLRRGWWTRLCSRRQAPGPKRLAERAWCVSKFHRKARWNTNMVRALLGACCLGYPRRRLLRREIRVGLFALQVSRREKRRLPGWAFIVHHPALQPHRVVAPRIQTVSGANPTPPRLLSCLAVFVFLSRWHEK